MKLRIMRSAWIALLFMSLSVTAQTTDKPEWSNEQVSGVNKEEAVQIAIPVSYTHLNQALEIRLVIQVKFAIGCMHFAHTYI